MKLKTMLLTLVSVLLFTLVSVPLFAQDEAPSKFGVFGVGYFAPATPNIQGWAALALPITSDGKALSYTDYRVAVVNDPLAPAQFSVVGRRMRYTMGTGLAYKALDLGGWAFYGLAAPGFAADGTGFRGAFEYGGLIHRNIKNGWGILIALTNDIAHSSSPGEINNFSPRIGFTKKF